MSYAAIRESQVRYTLYLLVGTESLADSISSIRRISMMAYLSTLWKFSATFVSIPSLCYTIMHVFLHNQYFDIFLGENAISAFLGAMFGAGLMLLSLHLFLHSRLWFDCPEETSIRGLLSPSVGIDMNVSGFLIIFVFASVCIYISYSISLIEFLIIHTI